MHIDFYRITAALIFASVLAFDCSAGEAAEPIGPPSDFIGLGPAEIKWIDNPEVPGVQSAVLIGDPKKSGPLVVRVKLPPKIEIQSHTHVDARTYTILSGEWKLGFGEKFSAKHLLTFPAGTIYRLPANVPHFQAAGNDGAIIQIESIGPTSTDFINPGKTWSFSNGMEQGHGE